MIEILIITIILVIINTIFPIIVNPIGNVINIFIIITVSNELIMDIYFQLFVIRFVSSSQTHRDLARTGPHLQPRPQDQFRGSLSHGAPPPHPG